MPNLLLAFDFDHTIIDDNSDTVVRDLLKEKPTRSHSSSGWTSYMQEIFTMLAAQGTTEHQIRKAVVDLQEVNGFSNLMEYLQNINAEVIIISDSNEYFIHHWLVGKGFVDKVKKVFSNPAKFVKGELKIEKYHVQDWCQNSTENLCKGYILENYINDRKCEGIVFDQVLYVGDGQNDYCPSTKLRETDVTFPRVGYALQKKLEQLLAVGEKTGILATICPWTTHDDILNFIRVKE
uniref:Pyridoxal phosphate phosphatase PHOSPHO2 n=2 Tax=Lygus hesperus TaxID=30085 RepID=A0A0A9WZ77_LYGHE